MYQLDHMILILQRTLVLITHHSRELLFQKLVSIVLRKTNKGQIIKMIRVLEQLLIIM